MTEENSAMDAQVCTLAAVESLFHVLAFEMALDASGVFFVYACILKSMENAQYIYIQIDRVLMCVCARASVFVYVQIER
jgi:hypothetical protein